MNILNNGVNGLQETVVQRRQEREGWTEASGMTHPDQISRPLRKGRRIYKINNVVKTTEN